MTVLRHCNMTVAFILLGKDVQLVSLQMSQISALPFVKSLTSMPLVKSFGAFSVSRMTNKRAVQTVIQTQIDVFSLSAVIPFSPDAHLFFNFFPAVVTSSVLGRSTLTSICKKGGSGPVSGTLGLGLIKPFSKYEARVSSDFCGSKTISPFSFFTKDSLFVFFSNILFVSQ